MNSPYLRISNTKNYRERIVMTIYHAAKLVDAAVFFGSLTLISSDFGAYIIFNDWLNNWMDNE